MLCKEYQTKNANQLIFKRLAFYHVLENGKQPYKLIPTKILGLALKAFY